MTGDPPVGRRPGGPLAARQGRPHDSAAGVPCGVSGLRYLRAVQNRLPDTFIK